MSYITLNEAKEWLGISLTDTTKDTLLTDLIASSCDAIDAWTESKFNAPIVVTKELHDVRRQDVIIPEGWPLISVQKVVAGVDSQGNGGSELPSASYNSDSVEIKMLNFNLPKSRGYLRVDYTYGYAVIPAKVKLATKITVEGYYRMRTRQAVGITSKSKEGESISYQGAWHKEAGLPVEAIGLLSSYRRIDWPVSSSVAIGNV